MEDRALQGVTNKLDAWAANRALIVSTSRTVNMIFRKRTRRNEEPMEIILNNKNLHVIVYDFIFCYLGKSSANIYRLVFKLNPL